MYKHPTIATCFRVEAAPNWDLTDDQQGGRCEHDDEELRHHLGSWSVSVCSVVSSVGDSGCAQVSSGCWPVLGVDFSA